MTDSAGDIASTQEPLRRGSPAERLFGAAFREHHAALVGYLRRRVGTEADAADIAQEAYLRLLRYRDQQNLGSLKALLYRIATNLVFVRARQKGTQRVTDLAPLDDLAVTACTLTPEQQLASQQQLALILAAIEALPEKCRNVFLLSRFHGMSNPEIAQRYGISVRMVEKQITRALAACRAQVRDFDR